MASYLTVIDGQNGFFPEEPETYPDETGYMVREDVEALRKHVESDIAGDYYRSIPGGIRDAANSGEPRSYA